MKKFLHVWGFPFILEEPPPSPPFRNINFTLEITRPCRGLWFIFYALRYMVYGWSHRLCLSYVLFTKKFETRAITISGNFVYTCKNCSQFSKLALCSNSVQSVLAGIVSMIRKHMNFNVSSVWIACGPDCNVLHVGSNANRPLAPNCVGFSHRCG
jgi:hypothetical protein